MGTFFSLRLVSDESRDETGQEQQMCLLLFTVTHSSCTKTGTFTHSQTGISSSRQARGIFVVEEHILVRQNHSVLLSKVWEVLDGLEGFLPVRQLSEPGFDRPSWEEQNMFKTCNIDYIKNTLSL